MIPAPFTPQPQTAPIAPEPLIAGGPIAAMHRDLQARLLQAFPAKQFQHRTAPARFTPDEFATFTSRLPLVALGWVNMKPPSGDRVRSRVWSGRAHWQLFLLVKHGQVEGQILGDALGCGLLGMLAVATAALHGRKLGGIGAAEVSEGGQAYSEAWSRADLAQAVLNISAPFDLVDAAGLARLDEFLRLGQRWDGLPDLVADIRDDGVSTE